MTEVDHRTVAPVGPPPAAGTWPPPQLIPQPPSWGQPPAWGQPPPPAPAPAWRNRCLRTTATAALALIAGLGGGLLGAHIGPSTRTDTAAVNAQSQHQQDINLCSVYGMVNAAGSHPDQTRTEGLVYVVAMQQALDANPGASPQIRSAMADVFSALHQIAAYKVDSKGLSQQPALDDAAAKAAYDHGRQVCGLD
ncbi:hypothetical protein KIH27_21390 [Mycobacterium sp. M1]|uniref:DUF732 domain-containing protein n=1 Tax=Mycolicibacter acidiphilus TaxID=2835306 RepID=A0ABS5RQ44_9MYCO|nr:hypothetical protein [Mycolicibacter acidiphilus]MBS9536142.1 hypothetical protein [Mycolicibacter acidiphilus]